MSNSNSYSVAEWDLLRQSPLLAGLIVVSASPSGVLGLLKEGEASTSLIREAGSNAESELMKALAADWSAQTFLPKFEATTHEEIQADALARLRDVAAILAAKATEPEAEELKTFLNRVARAVAEAAKEGGFLGFGGTLVSEAEHQALRKIAFALGTSLNAE
jgi:hypothetical protein